METLQHTELSEGITCLDTGMIRPQLAACYLVESRGECALIETGTHNTIPVILEFLQQKHLAPEQIRYVIPTHVHLDHAGGAGGLMQHFPHATLVVHHKGARHLMSPAKLKAGASAVYGEERFKTLYGDIIPIPEDRIITPEDGDTLPLGERVFTFFDTPGHARHHFCLLDSQSSGVFTGDTFGIAYPDLMTPAGPLLFPTTTPVQFDPEALVASIQRLAALQAERAFLTHFGVIESPSQFAPSLIEQIEQATSLTRELARSSNLSEQTLAQALMSTTVKRYQQQGGTLSQTFVEERLRMDMTLNAQGLLHWFQSI